MFLTFHYTKIKYFFIHCISTPLVFFIRHPVVLNSLKEKCHEKCGEKVQSFVFLYLLVFNIGFVFLLLSNNMEVTPQRMIIIKQHHQNVFCHKDEFSTDAKVCR